MFAKLCIVLLLAVGLSQAEIKYLPDGGLLQFMMQSRDLSLGNPECFVYYVPVLNDIVNQYQKDYELCLENAEAARQGIDDTTAANRTEIDKSASNACSALKECSAEKSALTYFECYVNAGSENAKSMYTISANSAELLAQVQEDYRLIQVNEFACTNKSERAYVENTAAAYADLDDCLKGIKPVPTASPDTTTSTTTSGSTEVDTSSSTNSEPITSESTSTTPDSSTSSDAPEESSSSSAAPEIPTSSDAPEESSSSSAAPEIPTSSDAPEESSSSSAAPEISTSSDAPEESSSSSAAPTIPTSSANPEVPTSSDAPEESSSSSAAPEESSPITTEAPASSTTSNPEREQMPEEDLRAASNADIKSIIDNLKNWLKRH